MLRIVWEMEKPKNLTFIIHGHEIKVGLLEGSGYQSEGAKRGNGDNCNSIINKIYLK